MRTPLKFLKLMRSPPKKEGPSPPLWVFSAPSLRMEICLTSPQPLEIKDRMTDNVRYFEILSFALSLEILLQIFVFLCNRSFQYEYDPFFYISKIYLLPLAQI